MAAPSRMANNWRVLIDLNVLLDVLMRREPYFGDAARLWALVETGQVDGFVAAHSFTTLFYLYRRQGDRAGAYWAIRQILQVFHIAGINRSVIEAAAALGWTDFEDAVQASAARGSECDYIVTRNTRDYQEQPVPAMQPPDFLTVWAANLK
ncbi:MAG: PIN domain-containing protein [Anaerolineales bacterium]